jgi:fumarate hydratase subunit beta
MSAIHYLKTPISSADLQNLKIGDKVLITGKIFTARDAAHQRLMQLWKPVRLAV